MNNTYSRSVRVLSETDFHNTVSKIIERFSMGILSAWVLALFIAALSIGVNVAAAAIPPGIALLWTGYCYVNARARILFLVSGKFLYLRSGQEVQSSNLPETFRKGLTEVDPSVYWHKAECRSLPDFIGQVDMFQQFLLYILIAGMWEEINKSTLRISGGSEVYTLRLDHRKALALIPEGASWTEPWSDPVQADSSHGVSNSWYHCLSELTDPEAAFLAFAAAMFVVDRSVVGTIACFIVLPLIGVKICKAYRALCDSLQASMLRSLQHEEAAT